MKKFLSITLFALVLSFSGCSKDTTKKDSIVDYTELRISSSADPQSIDPRLVRNLDSVTVLHMLHEGLFRSELAENLQPGLAESVDISPDLKTYTFNLRDAKWSNGEPLTANDFEETWKSVLAPSFPAPNAYQLYLIKGAKAFKEGKGPISEVAIHARDPKTLVVELEKPTAYFLELTSTRFYFPVHHSLRKQSKPTEFLKSDNLVSSGPFLLDEWKPSNELTVKKNVHYWDQINVTLNKIKVFILDEHPALQMFEGGELDWTGSPMSTLPQDAVHPLKEQNYLFVAPAAGTHWFRFNTTKFPLQSVKLRRALSLALDRQAIVEHILQGNQTPAYTVVPPSFGLETSPIANQQEVPKAWELFQEVLQELNLEIDQFPSLTLTYLYNDRNHKIAQAIQQQWKKTFNIPINLESLESNVFYEKLARGDNQISLGSWYADYRDPISFLDLFKSKTTPTNNTGWEHPEFTALLDQSSVEQDSDKRKEILSKAETLLLSEMPIAPLFHPAFNYVKNPKLKGIYFSDLGYLDFKSVFWENPESLELQLENF